MKNKKKQWLASIALVALTGPAVSQAQYDYQSIDYPGQANTNIWGINDSGDAVGVGFGPDNISFVYASMDGMITEVAPPAGYLQMSLLAINDAGTLAGTVLNLDGVTSSGVILGRNGAVTIVDHPDTTVDTTIRGINNRGLASGTYVNATENIAGFLYNPKTETFTELVPSFQTIPHAINSKGTIVGSAVFESDPCGVADPFARYGWVRDKDGSVVLFQVNGQRTVLRGINDAGLVTGNVLDPFTGDLKGFVIEAPETNCEPVAVDDADLLKVPGAVFTFPEGITNSGDVVGIAFDGAGTNSGFIATEQ